jgi:hypothetical protein
VRTILADTYRLDVLNALPGPQSADDVVFLGVAIGRDNEAIRSAAS